MIGMSTQQESVNLVYFPNGLRTSREFAAARNGLCRLHPDTVAGGLAQPALERGSLAPQLFGMT